MTIRLLLARLCIPCLVAGVGLYVYAGMAIAQVVTAGESPSWGMWFQLGGSLLLAVGGAYVKGLNGRLSETRAEVKALALALAEAEKVAARDQAHAKAAADTLAEVKLIALSVQRRLDQLHVNSAFPHQ